MLVAIEGIDGAGKGTLTRNLEAAAGRAGLTVATLSFPRYEETCFSALIAQYLNGRFGALDQVPVRFAALLYAGDRFETRDRLQALLHNHQLVILDRYVASNMAYNAAKLPEAERADLIGWLEETEFGIFGLPRPDLTLLLDTATGIADELVARKEARSYTERTRDLHEAAGGYMDRVAAVYAGLAAADPRHWRPVRAADATGTLRTPEAIAADAWSEIATALKL